MNLSNERQDSAVAVVLVNWNGWRDTLECLDSLLGQDYANFSVLIVDNASTDESLEKITAWCNEPVADPKWRRFDGVSRHTDTQTGVSIPWRCAETPIDAKSERVDGMKVSLIRSGDNLGFAGGCNVGIGAAGLQNFRYFWLLNTDTVVRRDSLSALVRRAELPPRPGMTGSTIRYYAQPEIVQALGGARIDAAGVNSHLIGMGRRLDSLSIPDFDVEREMAYVMGASLLVSAEFVRDVGMMQEDYFLFGEELDWAMRGKGRYTLAYSADSHVFHKGGAATSKANAFATNLYYRNHIRLAARFFPERMGAVERSLVWSVVRLVFKGRWSQARLVFGNLRQSIAIQDELHALDDAGNGRTSKLRNAADERSEPGVTS